MDICGGYRSRIVCRGHGPFRALLLALTVGGVATRLEATLGVSLVAIPPGPAPVGTPVTWAALVSDPVSGDLWYRFRARLPDGSFRMIRDYSPLTILDWTSLDEGTHEVELSVRDRGSLETATALSSYRLESRVRPRQSAVSPTSHPLVFLFSGPGCRGGSRARVQFQSAASAVQYTPWKPCVRAPSINFYLAGLTPSTSYSASLAVERGRESTVGPAIAFMTGGLPADLVPPSVVQAAAPVSQKVLLQFTLFLPAIATDLNGNVLWFGPPGLAYSTHPEAGGTFFGIFQPGLGRAYEVVRRFDLVGTTVQETNVARVNEQLAALGRRPISGFHHEARFLSDGRIVVLAAVEQILTDVQGPGPVNVLGDMILVLDADLQVVWTWDTFDHLDTSRRAVGGETCLAFPGCSTFYLTADANDWTHGNSVVDTPDGALLYSCRHQDWLIKIDYGNGAGDGKVIWRLGKDGDFTYESDDPYPWFSHQHDAAYAPGSRSTITLFDNGNTRVDMNPGGVSRGQAVELDEERRTARLVLNADLGVYSAALGSAQKLEDGTFHFDVGFVFDLNGLFNSSALAIQIDPSGNVVSSLKLPRPVYRSFRVEDLYGSPGATPLNDTRSVNFRE